MASVPHAQWVAAGARPAQPPPPTQQHRVWRALRRPFVLPSWALHEHEWERYDCAAAGCVLCGAQHLCGAGHCDAVECEDGARVCPVTAYSIPCIRSGTGGEFTDCQSLPSAPPAPADTPHGRTRESVQGIVAQALGGARARGALEAEWRCVLQRRAQELTRICRARKLRGGTHNVVDIAAELAAATGNLRAPLVLDGAALAALADACTDSVTCFLCALGMLLEGVGHAKMFALVLGLLYMMRHGVSCNDAEMLPCVPALQRALPLENAMLAAFGVRPKIITETENAVKMALRQLSQRELAQYCRLRALR